MIADMGRPNWVYWQEQGKWCAHPEGSPDREIQAASFNELQFKVDQLSRDVTKNSARITRLERPNTGILKMDMPKYVLSQDQGKWRGYLEGYAGSSVQGESFDEVQFKLYQLYRDLIAGKPADVRKIA